jgi:hypothetical protein
MDQSSDTRPAKRPYEKPELRKIKLEAGEMAAAGCKTSGGSMGPTVGGCMLSMCMTLGS